MSNTNVRLANRPLPPEGISSTLAQAAVCFLLFVSVVAPVVTISSALPWFRVEQLALIPIGLVYLWLLLAGLARPVRPNAMFLIGAVYCMCILLSIFFGTFVLGHEFLYRDLYEIPKAVLPVIFFTLGLESYLSEAWIRRTLTLFAVGVVLASLYAWAQWMDLGVAHQLAAIYSGGAHDEGSLAHYRRVYSTMGNPNLLGQLMTWSVAAFTLAAMFRVGNRFRNFAIVCISLVTLAMTGSRYGLLDTGLVFVLIFMLASSVRHRRRTLMVFLLVLVPLFSGIVFVVARSNQATLERFQTLRDPTQTDSFRGRIDALWPQASEQVAISPLLGHGPAKVIFSDVVTDSEYLDVVKEFGIVGLIAYLAYYVYPMRRMWRGLRHQTRNSLLEERLPGTFWALQFSFIMLITALVMNIGMSTFYGDPIQGFFFLWLGIGVGAARTIDYPVGFSSHFLEDASSPKPFLLGR